MALYQVSAAFDWAGIAYRVGEIVEDDAEAYARFPSKFAAFDGTIASVSATGLTGATSASRYVGATASGAPASGTFLVGDFVVDQTGQMWVCTVAGSPGTWAAPGSGRELGYASITANQTGITGLGTANKVAVTGLSVTVTVASRPIKVIAECEIGQSVTADGGGIGIVDNADTSTLLVQRYASDIGTAPLHAECRLAPAAGSKTYAVYAWAITGGSVTITAGAQNPAFIQVVEL